MTQKVFAKSFSTPSMAYWILDIRQIRRIELYLFFQIVNLFGLINPQNGLHVEHVELFLSDESIIGWYWEQDTSNSTKSLNHWWMYVDTHRYILELHGHINDGLVFLALQKQVSRPWVFSKPCTVLLSSLILTDTFLALLWYLSIWLILVWFLLLRSPSALHLPPLVRNSQRD